MSHTIYLKENVSGLLRDDKGARRLVRPHRMYDEFRVAVGRSQAPSSVEWPQESEHVCWHCRRHFSSVPVMIPQCRNIDGSWTVYGNFCCFACLVRYMWTRRTLTTPEQISLVMQLAKDCGIEGRLPMAPPLEDLQESGGDMTWEEFDRLCQTTHVRVVTRLPPLVQSMMGIEETYEAVTKGGEGVDSVLHQVFGVRPGAREKTKEITELHQHVLSNQEQIAELRKTRVPLRKPKQILQGVSVKQTDDSGAMRRRMMSFIGEAETVAMDKLRPPTKEETRRRLASQPVHHHGTQQSLYEKYCQERLKAHEAQDTSTPVVQNEEQAATVADTRAAEDPNASKSNKRRRVKSSAQTRKKT